MSAGLQITGWPAHDTAISSILFGPEETSIFSLGIDGKVSTFTFYHLRLFYPRIIRCLFDVRGLAFVLLDHRMELAEPRSSPLVEKLYQVMLCGIWDWDITSNMSYWVTAKY